MSTKQSEYELKLDTLLLEIKKEADKLYGTEVFNSDIEDEFNLFMFDKRKGFLIDEKKHGIKVASLILMEVAKDC